MRRVQRIGLTTVCFTLFAGAIAGNLAAQETSSPSSTKAADAIDPPSPSDGAREDVNEAGHAGNETTQRSNTAALIANVTIFFLAVFVGFELITKVPPTLHTPLMSGSNAISGITIVGALLATGAGHHWFASLLGLMAVILATINVVGGFLVTDRMLGMFRRK